MIPSLYEKGYIVSYQEGDVSLQRTPINFLGSVDEKYHVVSEGDTLLSIAQSRYDDQFLWYIIADANPIQVPDIFDLVVGTILLIPNKQTLSLIYG
jgi:nucleoid-associated protein YgaU